MRSADLAPYRASSPRWRWLTEQIWRIEHAFERAKTAARPEDDTRLRIFFILALFAAGFMTLAVGAARIALSAGHVSATVASADARADLIDRNGQLLAIDLPHFGLYYQPLENWNPDEVRRTLSAALPQLSATRLDRALHVECKPDQRRADCRQYLMGGLTPDEKSRIDDLGLPGVSFEPESRRVYPLGPTAGHLIGFVDRGGAGLSGAEKALDGAIRSGAGKTPVALSIDLRVQAALQDELQKAASNFQAIGAAGLVVNVHTGEILGMSSYPAFDPNTSGGADPRTMINHVASTVYEPGSVFKVFTLAMGIDAGLATPDTLFDARTPLQMSGRVIHDYDKDNTMLPLWKVFTHSSNIGAARLGLEAGPERMNRYFRSFGLFNAAPSELSESARPLAPKKLSDDVIASMSFGHAIMVSPLALATGMSAVLNGGEYRPLTIRKQEGATLRPAERRVISEQTSRTMLDLMRRNAVEGTGGKADAEAPGYRLGGKTGSAEKALGGHYERNKLVSSFAAVFPTDGPLDADRYLVLIMLDEPKATKETFGFATGGWTAAPAAGRVIERIAPYVGVTRAPALIAIAAKSAPSPDQLNGGEH